MSDTVIKAKKENIIKAYDELVTEINQELEDKENELVRTEIDRIKFNIEADTYPTNSFKNEVSKCKEKSKNKLKELGDIKNDISDLKKRIVWLVDNKESILK